MTGLVPSSLYCMKNEEETGKENKGDKKERDPYVSVVPVTAYYPRRAAENVMFVCVCVDSKLRSVIRTYAPLRKEKPYCELKRCLISSFNTHLKWF